MKIQDSRPARAAWAATAFARFPVDAQPTVRIPSATAALSAVATTRSLNEREGCETASFFTQSRLTLKVLASRGDSNNGVNPVSRETRGSPRIGRNSRYRHSDRGLASIVARVGRWFVPS